MSNNVCSRCQKTYRIKDVRVDAHWNSYSPEPAYCHCPHCDSVLEGVYPDTVDLARHLRLPYILIFAGFFFAFYLGVATDSLGYAMPLTLFLFGAWLAKSSLLKVHRIIGWILVGISITVFITINLTSF
jgi:hypothetical protein